MKEWNYAFEATSKQQWLQHIKADLKKRSIESLAHEWWPDEINFPAHHLEDLHDNPVILPDSLFTQPPKIIEWLSATHVNYSVIQKTVHRALKSGIDSLLFDISKCDNRFELQWLEGVYTDMIDVSIIINPNSVHLSPTETLHHLDTIRIPCSDNYDSLWDIIRSNIYPPEKYRFMYENQASGDLVKELTSMFQKLIDDLSKWRLLGFNASDFLNKCILTLTPGKDFFKQIILTRVMHLLWHNLWIAVCNTHNQNSYYLECHILGMENIDQDKYLLQASSSALASSLSGVTGLCIHHPDVKNTQDFYDRIHRNIHHLLHLESRIYLGKDPLAGSYSIDFYTKKWSEKIWNGLLFQS